MTPSWTELTLLRAGEKVVVVWRGSHKLNCFKGSTIVCRWRGEVARVKGEVADGDWRGEVADGEERLPNRRWFDGEERRDLLFHLWSLVVQRRATC